MSKLAATSPEGATLQLADVEATARKAVSEIWTGPRRWFRRWAATFQWLIVGIGILVTVASAAQLKTDRDQSTAWGWVAVGAAAVLSGLSTMQGYYGNQSRVAHHELAVGKLYRLLDDIRVYKAGRPDGVYDPAVVIEFHERYKQIYSDLNDKTFEINTAGQAGRGRAG